MQLFILLEVLKDFLDDDVGISEVLRVCLEGQFFSEVFGLFQSKSLPPLFNVRQYGDDPVNNIAILSFLLVNRFVL